MKKNVLFFVALFTVSFFSFSQKGDSLQGFDRAKWLKIAANENIKAAADIEEFIYWRERVFINQKYHINQTTAGQKKSLPVSRALSSACDNTDFESGNFTGWKGAIGYNNNSASPLFVTTPNVIQTLGTNAPETQCSPHTLVTSAAGNDPYSGLPMLDPLGGLYACRLGGEYVNINSHTRRFPGGNGGPDSCVFGNPNPTFPGGNTFDNAGGEILQQTFVVTPNNDLFTYKYAVVLSAANHTSGQEPYFRVEVQDSLGNKIPCQQYYVEGDTNGIPPKGFLTSTQQDANGNPVYYLPWTSNSINLSTLLGQKVTVRFSAAGCTFAAHFCYAYIDASCGPVSLTNTIQGSHAVCVGQNDTLTAPGSGGVGSYHWTHVNAAPNPPNYGILGSDSTQQVIVTQPGTYEVLITYPSGCNYKIDTTIAFHPLPVLAITTKPSLCNGSNNATATVTPSGSVPLYTYSWSPAPGSGQGSATVSGLNAPATYTVTVTGGSGCSSTKTFTTTQPTALTASNTVVNVLCHGGNNGSATVTAGGGTPGYNYSWAPSGGNGSKATGLTAGNYTCTVLDTNGCSVQTIATITEPAILSATNIKRDIKCYGDSTGRDTVLASGGTPAYSYSWSPYRGTSSVDSVLVAGSYTCTITDAHGCITTTSCTIKQQPKLVLNTSSVPTPCGGISGSATVNPSGGTGTYTYSWALPVVSTTNTATIVSAGIYTVSVTDSNGCMKTASIAVSNTGGPRDTANLDHKKDVTCFGGNDGNATVHGVGGTGTLTYSWSPSGGGTPSTTDTTITNLTTGVYICTIIDAATCQTSVTDSIRQPAKITATTSSTNVSCFGGSNGTATVIPAGGNPGGYTYTWSPAPAAGQTTATATGLPIGTYTCTINDLKGCGGSATVTITQPPLLTASNTVNNVSCFGGSNGSSTVSASGGTTAYTYSWSPFGGTAATAPGLSAGTDTCTVTDSKGCKVISIAVIKQPTQLAAPITPTNISCFGGSNGSAVVTPAGGVPAYTYGWTPSGGTNANASGLSAGTYTITLTDAHGCSITNTTTLTQPTQLTSGKTVTNVTCNGLKNGTITAIPAGGTPAYSYSWNPIVNYTVTASGLSPGKTYTCTVSDANGCTVSFSAPITEPAVLAASIPTNKITCFGANTGKDSVITSGGTVAYTYSWSPNTATTSVVTGLTAGIYTCTVTDANGCAVTATGNVTQAPVIAGNPTETQAICTTNNGTATLHPTGGSGPLSSFQYSWSPSGGSAVAASGLAPGSYTCTITDSAGCKVQVPVTITHGVNVIAPNPTSQPAICLSTNGQAAVHPTGGSGTYTYSWTPGTNTTSSETGLAAGTYTCTITDSLGCTSTQTVVVAHGSNTIACNFSANPVTGMVPLPVTFSDSSSAGVTTWTWDYGDSGSGTGPKVTNTYTTPGTYTVTETITDANGCTSSSTVVIEAMPLISSVIVPNVFTPNGDGSNDEFTVKTIAVKNFDMKIFDRWGVLMSHVSDPLIGWDGKKSGGAIADAGTYYYVITATGNDTKAYSLTGFITLTR
ncbi:MAG TPA: gliding motility-associated C-terminal domain-containing protein [Bacteroidia bacterium]|jgi:gliding motility-associated-like protein|nr:gliding motility-associated C-terminal domain-containing protein [Bacteroidia bacterium]